MEFVDQFMSAWSGIYKDNSWDVIYRRYRRQARDVNRMRAENLISSSSPQRMTVEDIRVFLTYRNSLGNKKSELSSEISAMKNLFDFCGNMAVSTCLKKYPLLNVRDRKSRLSSLTEDQFLTILKKADACPDDWKHVRSYALVCLAIFTGARPGEIRLAAIDDLDFRSMEFIVMHPKGEGSYGDIRSIPIPPVITSILERYTVLRSSKHLKTDALFPSVQTEDGYLSSNGIRVLKQLVEEECGFKFSLQTCRRTFGQQYLDGFEKNSIVNGGLDIETVSSLMGHATTKTTEGYYCRIKNARAVERAKKVWNVSEPESKAEVKDSKNDSQIGMKKVQSPGFEPGRRAWKARILTS